MDEYSMRPIGYVYNDFTSKFGIPRQSGLGKELTSRLVFEPEFRSPECLRGLEGYSHVWLLWVFSENAGAGWSPTVRPPRLGGNRRMGVFATRSPFRPNPIGLSAVRLLGTEKTSGEGTALLLEGADLMNGTPVLDIKPYLPFADAIPDAAGGFSDAVRDYSLRVEIPTRLENRLPEEKRAGLRTVLANDPRPSYQDAPERIYGFPFAGFEIKFRVADATATVVDIIEADCK